MEASINITSLISQLAAAAGNAANGDKDRAVSGVQLSNKDEGFDRLLARHQEDDREPKARLIERPKKVNAKEETPDAVAIDAAKPQEINKPRASEGNDDSRKVNLSDADKGRLKNVVSRLNDAADRAENSAKTPEQAAAVTEFRDVLTKLTEGAMDGTITVADAKNLLAALNKLAEQFPADPRDALIYSTAKEVPQLLQKAEQLVVADPRETPVLRAEENGDEPRLIDYEGIHPTLPDGNDEARLDKPCLAPPDDTPQLPDAPCPMPVDAGAPQDAAVTPVISGNEKIATPVATAEAPTKVENVTEEPVIATAVQEEAPKEGLKEPVYIKKAAEEKTAERSGEQGNNLPRFPIAVETPHFAAKESSAANNVIDVLGARNAIARDIAQNLNYNNSGQQQQQQNQSQQGMANAQISLQAVGANDNRVQHSSFNSMLNSNVRESVMEQIQVQIKMAVQKGASEISIQLEPERLGKLHIKMSVDNDGKTNLHVIADNADTFRILKNDARALEQILADSGLKTDAGSLSFDLRGGQQQQSQPEHQKAYVSPLPELKEEQFLHSLEKNYVLTVSDGGLDIKV